ncbi:NYN domain-containing protein [Crepidotus variabilis]|uniref:NYN domain-containing protein n=1 Tax=Crepidotus variabilis TaxID=179855 RepID=A0A9P6JUX7_9AGAR|nr:NYN domain-containing protein [Crepidotus variabilis]
MKNIEDVAIFWDYENCNAPANASGYLLASNIAALARPYGTIKQFRAYLEITEQSASSRSTTLRSELQSSGVSLVDCPHNGRKEVADKMLLVDMLAYAIDNPAPATMVIISGDRDFAYALATLKLRRYRLVLITLPHAHASLRCQASVCLDWFSDVVTPANTMSTLPCLSSLPSHRHQQRRSSEYAVPKRASPPLDTSRHASDTKLSQKGSTPDVDINQYLSYRKERWDAEISQWDVEQIGLGRKEEVLKPSTQEGNLNTAGLRKQTSSVDSFQRPTTLYTRKSEENPSSIIKRNYQTLENNQPPFFRVDPLDDEVFLSSSYSLPSTPEGLGSSILSPHSTTVGSAPIGSFNDRIRSTHSNIAPTSQPLPPVQTSLGSPMNLSFMPSTNLTGRTKLEQQDTSETSASLTSSTNPIFDALIDVLRAHRLKGRSNPLRSAIGLELAKRGNVYGKAGAANFKDYVTLAEKEGLVVLGGRDGYAWITLLDLC